ncbi:MAG: SpoIIE family protein phosphatase [Bacteroidetes bacterium]|nr:SpoIIE family protein phosphatase [Bacteroidota bacterium]
MSIIALFMLLCGAFSKFMHWAGASIEIILAIFLFVCGALPLIIIDRYEKRKGLLTGRVILLNILDLAAVFCICIGFLFKFQHWPYGSVMLYTGIIMLISSFILWNISFRKEVKLRAQVEEKLRVTLHEVEEKQREITDSISYAKRIQQALIPPMSFIHKFLPGTFVYYQPKDIVAGDFYWAEAVEDTFLIAAADCTGHGVPGAMVSVVCSNALNRSIKEFGLEDPGLILDKTRELVLETFIKGGEDIKDGMDISLASFTKAGSQTEVVWAGANNPLWYIQNGTFHEIKANKQPIGKSDFPTPFTSHRLLLNRGDQLFLFTDGYADQFGGEKGKKFRYRQMEDLLTSIRNHTPQAQLDTVKSVMDTWKGPLEQVDDICVIGITL